MEGIQKKTKDSTDKQEPLEEKVLWVQGVHIPPPEWDDIMNRIFALRLPCKVIGCTSNLRLVGRQELLESLQEILEYLKSQEPTEKKPGYVS